MSFRSASSGPPVLLVPLVHWSMMRTRRLFVAGVVLLSLAGRANAQASAADAGNKDRKSVV